MENLDLTTAREIIASTPTSKFALLSVKGALKLESKGMKMSRGGSALKTAQNWLDTLQIDVKLPRTKIKAYPIYESILVKLGLIKL